MLFFFDVSVNGRVSPDAIGSELHSFEEMRGEAVHSLFAIAKEEATEDDSQEFNVTVRSSEGFVYSAALSFNGNIAHDKN